MKPVQKPEHYLGPSARMQAARDAAAKLERLARKAAVKKAAPRRRIKARTPGRAKDESTYRKEVSAWLALPKNHWCAACQPLAKVMQGIDDPIFLRAPATQCHHKFGRRGRLLLHKPFWVPVCEDCHYIITFVNPTAARKAGVLCPEGRYNDQSAIE